MPYASSLSTGPSHPLSNKSTPTNKNPAKVSLPLPVPDFDDPRTFGYPTAPDSPDTRGLTLHGNARRSRFVLSGNGVRRRSRRFWLVIAGVLTALLILCSDKLPTVGLLPSNLPSIPYSSFTKRPTVPGGQDYRRNGLFIPRNKHPIEVLMGRAEEKFEKMKSRQSRTVEEAVREYRRRYGRKPPKGFDKWFEFAKKKGIVLVDDFDTMNHDLMPFWGLSADQIESRRKELLEMAKSNRLLSITIRDGVVGDEDGPADSRKWPENAGYHLLFEYYSKELPDMNMVLNLNDQPVVFVSYDEKQRLIEHGKKGIYAPDSGEIPVDPVLMAKTRGFGFEDLRGACPPDSPARTYTTDLLGETIYPLSESSQLDYRLPTELGGFVHNAKKQTNVCTNPSLKDQQGNFLKVEMNIPMKRNRLYPAFSWSKYPASGDITIPTNFRYSWGPPDVEDWEKMQPKIAWRGTLTGMYPDSLAVFNSQRHRLIKNIQEEYRVEKVLLRNDTTGEYYPSTLRAGEARREWMDIGIAARGWNRRNEVEKVVEAVLYPEERMDNKQRGLNKMLLDVDGWGWSARYRELLRTSSAVVKTTAFHEAFTDWLIPWYHYIPINYDYADLSGVLLYFFGVQESAQEPHDEELKKIADRSQEWTESQMNWEMHRVYMYRLCLEWARLTAQDRSTMDYS